MPNPRLFLALPLPEPVRRHLVEIGQQLRERLPNARLRITPPDNIHITLRFFGTEDGQMERQRIENAFRERLAALPSGQVALTLTHFSAFPSPKRARVVWAGLAEADEDEVASLVAIQQAAEAVAQEAELEPETRRFIPHATFARLRTPARIETDQLDATLSDTIAVNEVELLASTLTPDGAVYERLARFALDD